MSRIICIDYGLKRSGLAISDSLKIIASGFGSIYTKDLFYFFNKYVSIKIFNKLVIGFPKNFNNKICYLEFHIRKFIKKFKIKFPFINIIRVDERLTSRMAYNVIKTMNIKKKKRKKTTIDEISAIIILQSYINEKNI